MSRAGSPRSIAVQAMKRMETVAVGSQYNVMKGMADVTRCVVAMAPRDTVVSVLMATRSKARLTAKILMNVK